MTQVKLWQIVSQSAKGIIFSDANGNLSTLPAGGPQQVLVAAPDGTPMWAENTALANAIQAQTDAATALANAKAYTEAQIAALVDNAPLALNTLNELALKLNGEDSAINALLVQMDGKAEKTEMDTQVAIAKQDAIHSSSQYTDSVLNLAMLTVASDFASGDATVQAMAFQDATAKADAAQMGAIAAANDFTTQSVAQAIQAASDDAAVKVATAKADVLTDANEAASVMIASAIEIASNDAQAKVEEVRGISAADASSKVAALQASIPTLFHSEVTSSACFLANSTAIETEEAQVNGIPVAQVFTEITGSGVTASEPDLKPKLLFVNGVAMANEWTVERNGMNQIVLKLQGQLFNHVFDGTSNSLMLFAEYKRTSPIIYMEQPQ